MKKKEFEIAAKDDYTDLFNLIEHNFLVGGDFNAKHSHWGSRLISTKSKRLQVANLLASDTNKIPDLIDFFVAKGIKRNEDSYI